MELNLPLLLLTLVFLAGFSSSVVADVFSAFFVPDFLVVFVALVVVPAVVAVLAVFVVGGGIDVGIK